ncbi:MAG: Hint domain-containing protein, partial [Elusimicrobiota bacterium]
YEISGPDAVISMREGSWKVVGVGTVYRTGSSFNVGLGDGKEMRVAVTSGSLTQTKYGYQGYQGSVDLAVTKSALQAAVGESAMDGMKLSSDGTIKITVGTEESFYSDLSLLAMISKQQGIPSAWIKDEKGTITNLYASVGKDVAAMAKAKGVTAINGQSVEEYTKTLVDSLYAIAQSNGGVLSAATQALALKVVTEIAAKGQSSAGSASVAWSTANAQEMMVRLAAGQSIDTVINGQKTTLGINDLTQIFTAVEYGKQMGDDAFATLQFDAVTRQFAAGNITSKEQVVNFLAAVLTRAAAGNGIGEIMKAQLEKLGFSYDSIMQSIQNLGENAVAYIKDVVGYLKSHTDQIFNCAIESLSQIVSGVSKGILAFQTIMTDVLSGNFQTNLNNPAQDMQLSMEAMQNTARMNNVTLTGYKTDVTNLITALNGGQSAVLHVNGDHFVTVQRNADGTYSYTDNGKTTTLDAKELKALLAKDGSKWDGNVLLNGTINGLKALDSAVELRKVTGAKVLRCCFAAGTMILMADGTSKKIESITTTEKVMGYDGNTTVVEEVLITAAPLRDHICVLAFSDGTELRLTREHPLYSRQGWKSLSPQSTAINNPELHVTQLSVGDQIF